MHQGSFIYGRNYQKQHKKPVKSLSEWGKKKVVCCWELSEMKDKGFYFSACNCQETGPEDEKYKQS